MVSLVVWDICIGVKPMYFILILECCSSFCLSSLSVLACHKLLLFWLDMLHPKAHFNLNLGSYLCPHSCLWAVWSHRGGPRSTIFTTTRAHKYCNVWRCILVNNLRIKSHAGWMHAWDKYWAIDGVCSRRGDGLSQGHLRNRSFAWSVLGSVRNKISMTQSKQAEQAK